MIAIENLHKRYGGSMAVDGLSFEARDGEITGLLGANGAGKTTTLRIIAGVLVPESGTVRITGGPESVGALLDHTGLYSRLTAARTSNISAGCAICQAWTSVSTKSSTGSDCARSRIGAWAASRWASV